MAKKSPKEPQDTEQEAAPVAAEPVAILPTADEARADLEANPGRESVLSVDGWVTR